MFYCNTKFYKKNIIVTLNSIALYETYCFKIIWRTESSKTPNCRFG